MTNLLVFVFSAVFAFGLFITNILVFPQFSRLARRTRFCSLHERSRGLVPRAQVWQVRPSSVSVLFVFVIVFFLFKLHFT